MTVRAKECHAFIGKAIEEGWGAVIIKTISLDSSKVINVAPRYARLRTEKELLATEELRRIVYASLTAIGVMVAVSFVLQFKALSRFWILSILFALLSLSTLKLR